LGPEKPFCTGERAFLKVKGWLLLVTEIVSRKEKMSSSTDEMESIKWFCDPGSRTYNFLGLGYFLKWLHSWYKGISIT
jgi:hypothetical protein